MIALFSHAGHSHDPTEAAHGAAASIDLTLVILILAAGVATVAGVVTYMLVSQKQKNAAKAPEDKVAK